MKPTANCKAKGDLKSTTPHATDIEAGQRTGGALEPRKMKRRLLIVRTPAPHFPLALLAVATLIVTPLLIGSLCVILMMNDTSEYAMSTSPKTTAEIMNEIKDITGHIRNMLSNEDTMSAMKADREFINDILAHILDTLQRVHVEAKMLAQEGQAKKSGMDEEDHDIDSNKNTANIETTPEPSKLDVHIHKEKKADSLEELSGETINTNPQSHPKPV